MGYYTEFRLKIDCNEDTAIELFKEFVTTNETAECALGGGLDEVGEESKWYDHEKDLKAFSLRHSGILFILEGNGEEDGDMWIKYFINGKMQMEPAQITYAPFDPAKLQ